MKSVTVFNGDGKIFNNPNYKSSEDQIINVKNVFSTGERIELPRNSNSERIIYTKANVDDEESASHGDKVIKLVFDMRSLDEKMNEMAMEQFFVTSIFALIGGIVSLFLRRIIKI